MNSGKSIFKSLQSPIIRAFSILISLLLFREYSRTIGSNGVAEVHSLLSLLSLWAVGDLGFLNLLIRETAKYGGRILEGRELQLIKKRLLFFGSGCFLIVSAYGTTLSLLGTLPGGLPLFLVANLLMYLAMICTMYDKLMMGLGAYSKNLMFQMFANILGVFSTIVLAAVHWLNVTTCLFIILMIPFVSSAMSMHWVVKFRKSSPPTTTNAERGDQFRDRHQLLFFVLGLLSIIGNGYDIFLLNIYLGPVIAASFVVGQKLVNPFYTLLQTWIFQYWPKWESNLFQGQSAQKDVEKEVLRLTVLSFIYMVFVAAFVSLLASFISEKVFGLVLGDIGAVYAVVLYRVGTAISEANTSRLQTEKYLKLYIILAIVLNTALFLAKIVMLSFHFNVVSVFLAVFFIQATILNPYVTNFLSKKRWLASLIR